MPLHGSVDTERTDVLDVIGNSQASIRGTFVLEELLEFLNLV
jgi:hypothetical protein